MADNLHAVYNPPTPFTVDIGSLEPGRVISIGATRLESANGESRFTFNLEKNAEIAYHFDVRAKVECYRNVIVQNSFTHGKWETEEVLKDFQRFPFPMEQCFEATIYVNEDKFVVQVDNDPLSEYRHRLRPLCKFDTLRITGDLKIQFIKY